MSIEVTESNFDAVIRDKDSSVVALSGKWGTGKSYLWSKYRGKSDDPMVKGALYVSLFGVRDVDQIKMKLMQAVAPDSKSGSLLRGVFNSDLMGALQKVSSKFTAVNVAAQLAAPKIVKDKLIVLDDIERKDAAFNVDQLMGFIDECVQNYGAKFLLILNTGELADKEVWDKFREKVVDSEIGWQIAPSEAFGIAVSKEKSPYADQIKAAVETCGIDNIRVIRKIIRGVNRMTLGRMDLNAEIVKRIVPSTVLLSAIHHKGLVNGPTAEYVLEFNSFEYHMQKAADQEKLNRANHGGDPDDGEIQDTAWDALILALGIPNCDAYETNVQQFLKTGVVDEAAVAEILDRYSKEHDNLSARSSFSEYFDKHLWHPEITEPQLVEHARGLIGLVNYMDGFMVTALIEKVEVLEGGSDVAKGLLDAWLAHFNALVIENFTMQSLFNQRLHPAIRAAFESMEARQRPKHTLVEVALGIARNRGWSPYDELAMQGATLDDFVSAIRSLSGDDMRLFFSKFIELYQSNVNFVKHFGSALDNFAAACASIRQQEPASRLGKIIAAIFADAKLEHVLQESPAAGPDGADPA